MKLYDSLVIKIMNARSAAGISALLAEIEMERRMAARMGRQEDPENLNYIAHLEEAAARLSKGGAFE